MLRIRAFRAIDDEASCRAFMEGHARVLTDYGITNISTNNATWKDNSSVYVVVAETEDGEMMGGIRLHVTDGQELLPAEKAVGDQDPKMAEAIYSYKLGTTGELCSLWNARRAANWGLSMLLVRSLVTIASQVNLVSMFTLCAKYTVYMTKPMGFYFEESMANQGVFIYPVINYEARFFRNPDTDNLPLADDYNRNRIFDLRKQPTQTIVEIGPKRTTEVFYDLLIPNLNFMTNIPILATHTDYLPIDR